MLGAPLVVADEMQVDVGGKKAWLWNVMDSKTRYILASHLTPRRDAQAARVVLRKAGLAADGPPKKITTDKLRSYLQAVKDVLPEAEHISIETGQRYLDGWTLTYNLFRGHESLGNKTPGDRAKVNPPFKEWADVVKAGAASRPAIKAATRPASPKEPARVKAAAASVATAPGERLRRRSRIRTPKPVYPKVGRKSAKKHSPPPWAVIKPRLPGRN